jgi:hypothetical protein
MVEKAQESTKLPEWVDLTFVTLANRLSSRKDPDNKKSDKESDSFTKINTLTNQVFEWLRGKMGNKDFEKQAEQKLNNLEKARKEAADNFLKSLPDINISEFKADSQLGLCPPADPVKVLRTFCNTVIGVHTTLPSAEMVDVVSAAFRIVVLPQLHAHLHHIEIKADKNLWPKSIKTTADGIDKFTNQGFITPSVIAKLIVNNELQRKHLDSSSPKLRGDWHSDSKSSNQVVIQINKSMDLIRLLLRKAAKSDATWELAKQFATEYLDLEEQSNQQVVTGLSTSYLDFTNVMNLGELCDQAHQAIVANLTRSALLPFSRQKSFPQKRREILLFANLSINPSEGEILSDLSKSINNVSARLNLLTVTECLAYAYHFSKKTTLKFNSPNEIKHDPLTIRACELTCRLLEEATKTNETDLKVIALRYLAGYLTNPRFYCTSDYYKKSDKWIKMYIELEGNSLIGTHFQARRQFAEGKYILVKKNYSKLFFRAMPTSDIKSSPMGSLGLLPSKNQVHHLTDIECISYLLPECYAISSKLFENEDTNSPEESSMQRNIRRVSEAHFGICCNDWKLEERRILAGFKLRESYLKS